MWGAMCAPREAFVHQVRGRGCRLVGVSWWLCGWEWVGGVVDGSVAEGGQTGGLVCVSEMNEAICTHNPPTLP
jgi:hypothetical protein